MNIHYPRIVPLLVVVSLSSAAGWSLAQVPPDNLLPNGTFDSDISGWDTNTFVPEPNSRWVSEDAGSSPESGSAELDNIGLGNNTTQLGLALCLSSAPNLDYEAGATARMTTATTDALLNITVTAHDNASCTTSPPLHTTWLTFGFVDTWTTDVQTFTTPPGTTHVRVFIGVAKEAGVTETLSARVDNVYLIVNDTLHEDRFEAQ